MPEHPGTWKNKSNFNEKKLIKENDNNNIVFVKINNNKITTNNNKYKYEKTIFCRK